MSRATLVATKAELYGVLTASAITAGSIPASAITVYDHKPRHAAGPYAVTISTAGITPDFWVLALQVFAYGINDPKTTQDELDLLIPAVEARAGSNGGYDIGTWEVAWDEVLEAMVATSLVQVGRQDSY